MRILLSTLCLGLCLCAAVPASAQYVGVLQSAETMDKGVWKMMLAPIMVFGENGADDEWGLSARVGYGFTDRFDAEAKFAFYDNSTYAGVDGEFWILQGKEKDSGVDFSVAVGVHGTFADEGQYDTMGLDLQPLLSGHVSKRVELYAALDASFESISDAPANSDDSFTRLNLVPGIEYMINDQIDLVGEFGLGLNDDSANYAGIGLAFYLK